MLLFASFAAIGRRRRSRCLRPGTIRTARVFFSTKLCMFFWLLSEWFFERVVWVNVIKLIKLTQENAFSPPICSRSLSLAMDPYNATLPQNFFFWVLGWLVFSLRYVFMIYMRFFFFSVCRGLTGKQIFRPLQHPLL